MKHPVYLCLSAYILIFCIIHTTTSCPQPDFPTNGNYSPKESMFEPGDEVIYSCKKSFSLSGKERRICKANGIWSDHTPFCDSASQLENPSVESTDVLSSLVSRAIDGNIKTCFEWSNPKGKHMYVHLAKKTIVQTVKIYAQKGYTTIQVSTGLHNTYMLCSNHGSFLQTKEWTVIQCKNNQLADTMKILVTENSPLTICEVEAYGKSEDECEHSPKKVVPNGHFEVSRSKAVLICDDGFRSQGSNRQVCENNNTWAGGMFKCEEILCNPLSSKGQPELLFIYTSDKLSVGTKSLVNCKTGYKKVGGPDAIFCQKNGTWTKTSATCIAEVDPKERVRRIAFGVVAAVVVLIVIVLLAVIIYFIKKQKNKEVVVVFQPQSDESAISLFETDNEQPRYESLPGKDTPEPPSTPRPMAKLSTLSRGGDIQQTAWKGTFAKNYHYSPERPID